MNKSANGNYPTLSQSELKEAPWNEKYIKKDVTICMCLSMDVKVNVPENCNDDCLTDIVLNEFILPSDISSWNIDNLEVYG